MVPAAEGENATMGAGIPEELENDPYNILNEVFAIIPDLTRGKYSKLFHVPGLRELILKLTGFDIHNIPESLFNSSPKMFELLYRNHVKPLMKGVGNMKNKKNPGMGFVPMLQGMLPTTDWKAMMPPMPPMPPMPMMFPMPFMSGRDGSDGRNDGGDAKANLKKFWEQSIDMEKSSMESSKEQWSQFFEHLMDIQDLFIESLSEDALSLPGFPFGQMLAISPKDFMKQVKEFQKMANEHFVEQANSVADMSIKGKEKVCDMVYKAMDSGKEEKDGSAKAEDSEQPAGQPAEQPAEQPAQQ